MVNLMIKYGPRILEKKKRKMTQTVPPQMEKNEILCNKDRNARMLQYAKLHKILLRTG